MNSEQLQQKIKSTTAFLDKIHRLGEECRKVTGKYPSCISRKRYHVEKELKSLKDREQITKGLKHGSYIPYSTDEYVINCFGWLQAGTIKSFKLFEVDETMRAYFDVTPTTGEIDLYMDHNDKYYMADDFMDVDCECADRRAVQDAEIHDRIASAKPYATEEHHAEYLAEIEEEGDWWSPTNRLYRGRIKCFKLKLKSNPTNFEKSQTKVRRPKREASKTTPEPVASSSRADADGWITVGAPKKRK